MLPFEWAFPLLWTWSLPPFIFKALFGTLLPFISASPLCDAFWFGTGLPKAAPYNAISAKSSKLSFGATESLNVLFVSLWGRVRSSSSEGWISFIWLLPIFCSCNCNCSSLCSICDNFCCWWSTLIFNFLKFNSCLLISSPTCPFKISFSLK